MSAKKKHTDRTVKKQEEATPKKPWLKKFPKGKSGNPKGRPKGSISPTEQLRKLLNSNPVLLEAITRKWLHRMLEANDFRWFKEFIDRIDGKVAEKVDVGGASVFTVTIPKPSSEINHGD